MKHVNGLGDGVLVAVGLGDANDLIEKNSVVVPLFVAPEADRYNWQAIGRAVSWFASHM